MADWSERVALVTGATSGIGLATAVAFGKLGAKVVLAGRRADQGAEAARQVRAAGGEALFVKTDVADDGALAALFDEALSAFGRLDCAFNNAGIEGDTFVPLIEQSRENFERVFDVNVRAVMTSMQHELRAMQSGGVIVNNASVAGLVGFGGMSVYTASKHAVIGLTKAAALEVAPRGIRVNAVAPGAIETEMYDRFAADDETRDALRSMHPLGRTGRPEEIASGVVWLCSPEASFVTGHTLTLDGGFTAQ
jgi:NAD(P)-dependent dehydrogenase (short-subunit alcohol dehydrogenase family)